MSSLTRIEVFNNSGAHDLRISLQHAKREFVQREGGGQYQSIVGWGDSQPLTSLTPCQKTHVLVTDSSRAVIEAGCTDDILIAIGNPSTQSTLKVVTLLKKGDPVTKYIGPTRNGVAGDPVVVAISRNASALIQQMPV